MDRLFVMDASVFPTASGANPMVTTLAICHLLATRLASRLVEGFYDADSSDAPAVARRTRRGEARLAQSRTQSRTQSRQALLVLGGAIAVAAIAYLSSVPYQ